MHMPSKAALVLAGAILILWSTAVSDGTDQPIEFNHSMHVSEVGMDCTECHQYVDRSRKATLPGRTICFDCHEDAQGESTEEQKLVALLQSEAELDWQRVYELPEHVYFSHFRHVTLGQIGCQNCHGDMKELTSPPAEPATDILDMDYCTDCHDNRQASNDCLACHN